MASDVTVSFDMEDLKLVYKNIDNVEYLLKISGVRAVAAVAIDLLANTQPRVPYETGELRASGTAMVIGGRSGMTIVGTGKKEDATINADLGGLRSKDFSKTDKIAGIVSYSKISPRQGFDVAEYAHYNIYAYGAGKSPKARQYGTGPMFLKNTFKARKKLYEGFIIKVMMGVEFEQGIAGATKILNKRTGKFTVDRTEIVRSKIQQYGWNKSFRIN